VIDVTFETIQKYYNLLKAEELLSTAEEAKSRAESQLKLVNACFTAGIVPKSDILKAELELSQAEAAVLEAEAELDISYAELQDQIGVEIKDKIVPPEVEVKRRIESLDKYIDYALQNRLELKELEKKLEIYQ
jgi:outer membrane protein TolC